jgi:hypothetical protein
MVPSAMVAGCYFWHHPVSWDCGFSGDSVNVNRLKFKVKILRRVQSNSQV